MLNDSTQYGPNEGLCPFCQHAYSLQDISFPLDSADWHGNPCTHTLYVFIDSPAYAGFLHRSPALNHYLDVPADPDLEILIPVDPGDYNESMCILEIVERIELLGYQWLAVGNGFCVLYVGFHSTDSDSRNTKIP